MSKTTLAQLAQLAPLAAFLYSDAQGKYAQALDVHKGTIEFQLNHGVTFNVDADQVPFKVKPGYHVYFNDQFEAVSFEVPKETVSKPKVAKSTHGSGSTTVRSQVL